MCKVCTEAVHSVALWTRVTLGLGMCKVCTEAVHSVALWTRVTLGLGMCKVCTEAVHSVALWTRVTLGLGMCKVCTEAVHSVALWTRVTLGLDMCKVCTEALDMCEVCISCSVSFSAQNVSKNNPRLQIHETARPVCEMHINTRFPLGSTSEKCARTREQQQQQGLCEANTLQQMKHENLWSNEKDRGWRNNDKEGVVWKSR